MTEKLTNSTDSWTNPASLPLWADENRTGSIDEKMPYLIWLAPSLAAYHPCPLPYPCFPGSFPNLPLPTPQYTLRGLGSRASRRLNLAVPPFSEKSVRKARRRVGRCSGDVEYRIAFLRAALSLCPFASGRDSYSAFLVWPPAPYYTDFPTPIGSISPGQCVFLSEWLGKDLSLCR